MGKWWDQTLCIFDTPGIVAPAYARLHFYFDPLTFAHARKVQIVILFFIGKGEEIQSCPLHIWIAWWLNFFIFLDFGYLHGEKRGSKLDKVSKLWVSPVSWKFEFFQNSLNTVCVSLIINSGKNFSKVWQHLGKLGPKKPPKRAISWMLHCHKNIWKFTTSQPQML